MGQRKWPRIFELLQASKIPFEFAMTKQAGDGTRLAAAAAKAGYDAIIAVGGDGTINEVISGIILGDDILEGSQTDQIADLNSTLSHETSGQVLREFLASQEPRFGVIYTGTSPDFCAFHGLSINPDKIIPKILAGQTRQVDLCRITHRIAGRELPVQRVFSCAANFGLGAAIARGSNSGLRKRWGDFMGTFLSVLQAIRSYEAPSFTVRLDGREEQFSRVHNLFVGKSPFIASGIKLQLDITHNDGRMFLVPLCGISKLRVLAMLPRVYTGSFCRDFPPRFCRTIDILNGGGADEVEYDGDPRGLLPAHIQIMPKALSLLGIG